MPENDGGDEPVGDIHRRQFLASGATGIAAGGLFAGGAVAQSGTTVTVTQGGASFEVEPLSYQNQSVEQFYSYDNPDGASANTPTDLERSDTTRLFFYEGPQGLSFVVIHDRPNDGDGGEVRFDFQGLSSGSWVVPDDPGETSYDLNDVTWGWAPCCTDGGALRGVSGATFTLQPAFRDGIGAVEVLSGDPANPDVRSLSLGESIQFEVGGSTPTDGFPALREEKLQLASSVTSLSQAFDDRARVEPTLDELERALNDGSVSESTAEEAVERLILGENVTQVTVAGIGPGSESDGEADSFDDRLQTRNDVEQFNTAKLAIDGVISTFTTLLLHFATLQRIRKILPFGLGSRLADQLDALKSKIDDFIASLLGKFDDVVQRVRGNGVNFADDAEKRLREAGQSGAQSVGTKLFDKISGIDVFLSGLLAGAFETSYPGGVRDAVDDLAADAGGGGSVDVTGDTGAARSEAQAGIDDIEDSLQGAKDAFEFLDIVKTIIDILEVFALILAATGVLTIAGGALGTFVTTVQVLFSLTQSLVGFGSLVSVVDDHRETVQAVASPGVR